MNSGIGISCVPGSSSTCHPIFLLGGRKAKEKRVLLEQGTQLSLGQEKGILHCQEDEFH